MRQRPKISRRAVVRIMMAATAATAMGGAAAQRTGPVAVRLRRGMNLWPWFSLTREFPPPRIDYDWPPYEATRAVPGRSDLKRLHESGIDFIRIPVDPGPLLAFSGERRRALAADIGAAIDLALSENFSVILNLHPNGATHHFNPRNLVGAAERPLFRDYLGLVRDVAAQLARFDPSRVAFEPLNEPPQGCAAAEWPAMQAEIVRVARRAAPRTTLVVTGACGSMIAGLETLDPASVGDDNVIFTFHYYEPYVFSHQGAPWMRAEPMYRYLNAVPWPSSAGSLQATLAAVARRMAADTATPAGTKREIAALRTDRRYVAAPAADRARYIRDVRETAEGLGMPWAFWNFFDGMGLTVDDDLRAFDPAVAAALGLRMPG
jgi:hypothetical protein